MATFAFNRFTLMIGAAAALLTACGGSQTLIAPTGTAAHRVLVASSFQLLYHFPGSANDGYDPEAALTDVKGTLYGTTVYGGKGCGLDRSGCGTVFSLSTDGTEKVLHSFRGRRDGAWPSGSLIDVRGTLYGTTEYGGSGHGGIVFSISTDGHEKVLHAFSYGSDGGYPTGPLLDVNGTLYGTTLYGGAGCTRSSCGNGTVYSITTSGKEKVLYSFAGGSDGAGPAAGLIDVNGTLYGTTSSGGTGCTGLSGCGTVYSVTPSGTHEVLYSFTGGSDGQSPTTGLVNVNGILYGTTRSGGRRGRGTAYSVTTTGTEHVLHSFTGRRSDGAFPKAALIDVKGTLYGTTELGGGSGSCGIGCGTIYSLTTTGTENVLYAFQNDSAGKPSASLLNVKGVLYGTTPITRGQGCVNTNLCGTAFAFTP